MCRIEAMNRLLDSNQELFLPEINQTIKPHPGFRLFATQNPSGAYGGRKPLSRAFRNRFIEIFVDDIPGNEMMTILEHRCGSPPSHARILVEIMESLRHQRSKSGVFLGKDGYITPRDLLRWAERQSDSKYELAREGFMLLAERLRTTEEKACVREILENKLKVKIDEESLYYGEASEGRRIISDLQEITQGNEKLQQLVRSIAPTKSLLRLLTLVKRALNQKEPVLLVGGKLQQQ
jgi:midasin